MDIDDFAYIYPDSFFPPIYPGVFCPPTYGHLEIVKKACIMFPHLYIVCSVNPGKKKSLFTQEECVEMWKFYDLPSNCTVTTFNNYKKSGEELIGKRERIMIRGLRAPNEIPEETNVIANANKDFNFTHFHYILSDCDKQGISSSAARLAAENYDVYALDQLVCRNVASRLVYEYTRQKNKMG